VATLPPELRAVLHELPYSVAETLEGYANSVADSTAAIFEEAGVPRTSAEFEGEFVFAAAIRRLWALVDTQFWILTHSLGLLATRDIGQVRLGGARYSYGSDSYQEVRELRNRLHEQLSELDILTLATAGSLLELAQMIATERG
jgi:hypothetical protein